jgi:hypothetical protein
MEGKVRDRIAFGAALRRFFERGRVDVKKWMVALLEWAGTRRYRFRYLVSVASIDWREAVEQFSNQRGRPYK